MGTKILFSLYFVLTGKLVNGRWDKAATAAETELKLAGGGGI